MNPTSALSPQQDPPTNPWLNIPAQAPFVAPIDTKHVDAYQRINTAHTAPNHTLHLDLTPAPWNGNPITATVLILLQNPGVDQGDLAAEQLPGYRDACLRNLRFEMNDPTWPYLRPEFQDVPGGRWWHKRLAAITELAGGDYGTLCSQLAAVQLHGYHSVNWRAFGVSIPSQEYNFWLVRQAIKRNALIICTRGAQIWTIAVPELNDYANLHSTKNARAAYISPNNLEPEAWSALAERISPTI